MQYTWTEVAQHLHDAGLSAWQVRMLTAICMAESGRNPHAHGLNDKDPESRAYLSEDHGLLQVNDYWGPLVLSVELLIPYHRGEKSFSMLGKDPVWNCKAAKEMFELRWLDTGEYAMGYTCWNAYNAGKHEQYLDEATAACRELGFIR